MFPDTRDGFYVWSAAFVSYVMRLAGAGPSFPYSATHSDYINAAARHDPGIALTPERVEAYAPQRGDLICLWRGRRQVTFDQLPAGSFPGHCDIVVGMKPGELEVIGGNVDNAVAMKPIPATADGRLAGPDGVVLDPDHHWFVVLKVDYQQTGTPQPTQPCLPRDPDRLGLTTLTGATVRVALVREISRARAVSGANGPLLQSLAE